MQECVLSFARLYLCVTLMLKCKIWNENADKGRIRYVTQTIVLNEWCVELIIDLMYISWCLSRDDNVECGNISAGLVWKLLPTQVIVRADSVICSLGWVILKWWYCDLGKLYNVNELHGWIFLSQSKLNEWTLQQD